MRARLELLQGVLLLGIAAGVLVLFGVPDELALAAATLLFGVGGGFALLAGLRVERQVGERTVDHVTLRGLADCSLGLGMCVLGTDQMRDGDLFGLAIVLAGVFVLGLGVAMLQRRPSVISDDQ